MFCYLHLLFYVSFDFSGDAQGVRCRDNMQTGRYTTNITYDMLLFSVPYYVSDGQNSSGASVGASAGMRLRRERYFNVITKTKRYVTNFNNFIL